MRKFLFIAYVITSILVMLAASKLTITLFPILVVVFFWHLTRKERLINSLPVSKIGSIQVGVSRIEGTVYATQNLVSPYFKETCVGYLYTQDKVNTDSEGSDYYSNVLSESQCNDFYVNDPTGEIFVPATTIDLEFCDSRSHQHNNIRFTEFLVKHQQSVCITGNVVFEDNGWKFSTQAPVLVSSPNRTSSVQALTSIVEKMKWYSLVLYASIHYLAFFYDAPLAEPNSLFVFFSFFGLPVAGLLFLFIGSRFNSRLLASIASICLISGILSFPLMCVLYLQQFPPLIIQYIFCAILLVVTLFSVLNPEGMNYLSNKQDRPL